MISYRNSRSLFVKVTCFLRMHAALTNFDETKLTLKHMFENCLMLDKEFVCFRRNSPQWTRASSYTRFLDHTQRRTKVGWDPLHERSARRRDLCLTNTQHSQQTSRPPVGFIPTILTGERSHSYALDLSATLTGLCKE